jgi:hypothetical protein
MVGLAYSNNSKNGFSYKTSRKSRLSKLISAQKKIGEQEERQTKRHSVYKSINKTQLLSAEKQFYPFKAMARHLIFAAT